MLRIELRKAFHGIYFWVSFLTGILLAVCHAFWVADYLDTSFFQRMDGGKNAYFIAHPSFMQGWIGMDGFSTFGPLFYMVIFPLLAAMPYATSLCNEQKLGYDKQVIVRSGKTKYYLTKYITVFLTAGIVVTVPSVISLGIAITYLPLIPMESFMYQSGIGSSALWADIFYTSPLLYAFLYILLDFVIAGIMGMLSLAISWRQRSPFMILVLPMMLNMMLAEFFSSVYEVGIFKDIFGCIPLAYIQPGQFHSFKGWHVAVGLSVLLLAGSVYYWYQARTQDVLT